MTDAKNLVSIARKAGYVIIGSDKLIGYSKKLYLVVLDKTAGRSLSRETNVLCERTGAQLVYVDGASDYVKIDNCKIFAVKNKNFAERIAEAIKGE